MPIELVSGPANAGKAQVVLQAARAHAGRGEGPLLVVPTQTDQARYRRELAEGGSVLGVRVERFEGLLGEVLRRANLGEAGIGPLARERLLATLGEARPGLASELARAVAELEAERVTPGRLREALRAWRSSSSTLGGDPSSVEWLCAVFERYHQALARMRRADRELRVTRALDALRKTPALWGATPVLLYGFDDLTELQLDAIETIGGVVDADVMVSLAYEPGRTVFAGRAGAILRLAPRARAHVELPPRAEHYSPGSRLALHHLERSLLSDEPVRVDPGEAVRLLEGGSPRAELELVAGEIRALLDEGVEAQEIAIVHRSPETVAGLLGEVLADVGVPYAMRRQVRFAHTAVGRGLLGALRCAGEGGELADLLAWLRCPGVLERPALADRLEASARRQGVASAQRGRELWEAEHWPLDRIERLREASERGTMALLDALAVELTRLFEAPRRGSATLLDADASHEARAAAGGLRALEELRELARAAPELAPGPAGLIDALGELRLDDGERVGPGAVAVVDPLSLRARRVRMLFLCGMQEGVFPALARPQPLLAEEDRGRLVAAGGLGLSRQGNALAAERYLLYALVSRPEQRLTLSWHTADDDGAPVAPSLLIDDVCDLFEVSLRERTRHRLAGAADWPGPGAPAGRMALRERPQAPAEPSARLSATARMPVRPGPIEPLRDERVLEELCARSLWSASSIESWASCPVRWFVERLLRGAEIEPRAEPLARGGLAHAALRDTLASLRERRGSARLTPANVGLAKRLLGEALERHETDHPLSVAPERLPGARRRLRADLERYLEHAAEQASPLEPAHLELEFGFDSDGLHGGLPALELGEGVRLRGRIDRVDVGDGGEAVVYDYKSSSATPGARWASDGSLQVALYMRAVERLLGKRAVGGFYQPLGGRDMRARGVYDDGAQAGLDSVRTDRRERSELSEILDACEEAALVAVAEARAGALEPRPSTCAYGGGCAYPSICRCEL